jgi:hypothetical protein
MYVFRTFRRRVAWGTALLTFAFFLKHKARQATLEVFGKRVYGNAINTACTI